MALKFFLMTGTDFHMSYLITKWIEAFDGRPEFQGIIICGDTPQENVRQSLSLLHQEFRDRTKQACTLLEQLQDIYPNLSKTEQAMAELCGLSSYSIARYPKTIFLGADPNTSSARQWLEETLLDTDKPFIFVFLDQLLATWWIELTASRIINGHSAVLPYARGMFAIERVAALQDYQEFEQAAGATVHFINSGIDTGPIIRAERLQAPFGFQSIWECKAYIFSQVFDLLIQVAQDMLGKPDTLPVGTIPASALRGPNFKRKDFTTEVMRKAELGYLAMKQLRPGGGAPCLLNPKHFPSALKKSIKSSIP